MGIQRQSLLASEPGSATVEGAVTLFPVMLLLLGFIQLTVLAVNFASLQYLLNKAGRWASVGSSYPGESREASIKRRFLEIAKGFPLDTSDVTLSICPAAQPACAENNAGSSGQLIVLKANKPAQSILGVGQYFVSANVIVKNEPF